MNCFNMGPAILRNLLGSLGVAFRAKQPVFDLVSFNGRSTEKTDSDLKPTKFLGCLIANCSGNSRAVMTATANRMVVSDSNGIGKKSQRLASTTKTVQIRGALKDQEANRDNK